MTSCPPGEESLIWSCIVEARRHADNGPHWVCVRELLQTQRSELVNAVCRNAGTETLSISTYLTILLVSGVGPGHVLLEHLQAQVPRRYLPQPQCHTGHGMSRYDRGAAPRLAREDFTFST